MSAVHREWGNAQADRVVLVVDQVASVKSAPAHQPKRIASVSRATAREQAVERAQWLAMGLASNPRARIAAMDELAKRAGVLA